MCILILSATMLFSCLSKDVYYTDQQKRMQRCEQYIEASRERCLRGETVTIEDYKQDYREFIKKSEPTQLDLEPQGLKEKDSDQ